MPMKLASSIVISVLFVACCLLSGCVERTISITSEPPGALVYLNDQEIGRTPCEVAFIHHGTYDVRLVLDGYEPYIGPGDAEAGLGGIPPFDLFAEILPFQFHEDVKWHYDLMPVMTDMDAMVDRATQLRARLHDNDADNTNADEQVVEESASEIANDAKETE